MLAWLAWLDGRIVPPDALAVRADDPGLLIGDGLFETMLVRDGRVASLDAHLDRFERSRQALALPSPPAPPARAIAEVLARNGPLQGEHVLRLTFTARPTLLVTLRTLSARDHARRGGLDLHTLPARRGESFLARHKSLGWAANAIQRRLHPSGAAPTFEGLWLDPDGHVLEGTSTSLFAHIDGVWRTAPLGAPILPGVVRARALEHLAALGAEVREAACTLDDLARADALFATSAILPVAVIRSLDGRSIADPTEPSWYALRAALGASATHPR